MSYPRYISFDEDRFSILDIPLAIILFPAILGLLVFYLMLWKAGRYK